MNSQIINNAINPLIDGVNFYLRLMDVSQVLSRVVRVGCVVSFSVLFPKGFQHWGWLEVSDKKEIPSRFQLRK